MKRKYAYSQVELFSLSELKCPRYETQSTEQI